MVRLAIGVLMAASAPATVCAQFALEVPPDARSEGMGGAEVVLDPGPWAAWGNVGALGLFSGSGVVGARDHLVPDLAEDVHFTFGSAAWAIPVGRNRLVFDLNTTHIGYEVPNWSPYATGPYRIHDDARGLAVGVGIGKRLGLGVGVKWIRSGGDLPYPLFQRRATAYDFGLVIAIPCGGTRARSGAGSRHWDDPRVGVAAANFGAPVDDGFPSQGDRLPHVVRVAIGECVHLGSATDLSDGAHDAASPTTRPRDRLRLSASVSAEKLLLHSDGPVDSTVTYTYLDRHQITLRGGCEARLYSILALRAGYIYDDPGEIKGFTFGAGVSWREWAGFDFASIPQYTELSRVKKFSAWVRVPFPAER